MKNLTKARKKFAERIKQLRKLQGVTQNQLAFESGLSREEISRIENGVKNPSFETIFALSVGFDITLKELFDYELKD